MPMTLLRSTAVVGLMAACLLGIGCQKQPFISEYPRTPYDRYLALRGRERPATQRDAQGLAQRNARERLKPLDQ